MLTHHILILRSGPKDRVSKDATSDLQAEVDILKQTLNVPGAHARPADRGKASLSHLLKRGGKILELREPVAHRHNGCPPTIVFCQLGRDDFRLRHFVVIAGLDPAIHLFARVLQSRWMRGSSPRMTTQHKLITR